MSFRVLDHPVHTAVVHFPIGLCCTVPLWDAIWLITGSALWWQISFFTLAAGLVAGVPAVLTGLIDYVDLPDDDPALETATRHMVVTGSGLAVFVASFLVRVDAASPAATSPWLATGLAVAGAVLFGLGGWLGGELVLLHGVGRVARNRDSGDRRPGSG